MTYDAKPKQRVRVSELQLAMTHEVRREALAHDGKHNETRRTKDEPNSWTKDKRPRMKKPVPITGIIVNVMNFPGQLQNTIPAGVQVVLKAWDIKHVQAFRFLNCKLKEHLLDASVLEYLVESSLRQHFKDLHGDLL
jgi:hypothetical protein